SDRGRTGEAASGTSGADGRRIPLRLDPCSHRGTLVRMRYEFIGDDRPPPNWRRLHEAAWLVPRMWHAFARPRPLGPEHGPPALVVRGWAASDRTTLALRKALAAAGWRVHGWDMGWNRGARADTVERLRAR